MVEYKNFFDSHNKIKNKVHMSAVFEEYFNPVFLKSKYRFSKRLLLAFIVDAVDTDARFTNFKYCPVDYRIVFESVYEKRNNDANCFKDLLE